MRYHALATDYDATLASHAEVKESTIQALRRLRESGRTLLMVTGRELPDLLSVFPQPALFHRIVAENGALLYDPATRNERVLAEGPLATFVELLRKRGVAPLSVGRVIVASTEPNETVILQTIRDLGLELQVIFNKGAVMILPSGVNKATGLAAALKELGLSAHNVVAVGDAENDHAFLEYCECGAAVANALPSLKERADMVITEENGAGVTALIDQLLADDLSSVGTRLSRHDILLGIGDDESEVRIKPYGSTLLVAGSSERGNSTLLAALLKALCERGYQACIIDPRGEYADQEKAVVFGDAHQPPGIEGVIHALGQPEGNVVVNLISIQPEERPAIAQSLLPALATLRAGTGRPHWIAIDDAHRVLPASSPRTTDALPVRLTNFAFATVHPEQLARSILAAINFVVVTGKSSTDTLERFCAAAGCPSPQIPEARLADGDALGWRCGEPRAFRFRSIEPKP